MKLIKGYPIFLFGFLLILTSCSKEDIEVPSTPNTNPPKTEEPDICGPDCPDNIREKIWSEDGRNYLWGGENEDWHFDITSRSFNVDNLRHGLGREFFKALIEPQFEGIENPDLYNDGFEMIVLISDNEIKVYPIHLLTTHELINDEFNGIPISVSYCILADYVGVHNREYCGHVFTFGVSGYTYSDEVTYDGRLGFVLWDRDTESLWWPLQESSISGDMNNTSMNRDINFDYIRTDWKTVLEDYPTARVLRMGQEMDAPESWDAFDVGDCE